MIGDPGAFCWNELATRDRMGSAEFYTGLFGGEAKHHESGPMPYTEFHLGERAIGGMFTMGEQMAGVPPHWMVYFAASDCDASVAKATSLGASTIIPAMDIEGVGRFATSATRKGQSSP